jgi:Domain of unknown function (DUF4412)
MSMIAKSVVAAVAFFGFASPLSAAEGLLMVEKTVTGATTRTSQIQLERERLRADITGSAGETQIATFDGPQQVLRIINMGRKSYTEMTKADVDRMGAQLNTAMAAMKEKLATMPPEQRAKVEALMGRAGGVALGNVAPSKPDYRRTGTDKVGKWTCDKYEGFINGEKVSEVCTVDPKTLGLTPADFEISKQVSTFFQKIVPQGMDQILGVGTLETQGFNGVPIRRIRYAGGEARSTSEVIEVKRQTFDASTYEVPAGFTKQAFGQKPPR